jgi:type IV pilus biogenesis protein CpaD/CtpE
VSMPMGLYSACLRTNSPLFRGDHGPSDEILLISRLLAASSDRTLSYIETIWSTEQPKVMAPSGSTNATSSITMFINVH